jgi:hypothetical protein
MVKTIKDIFSEAASLNDYLSSRGINPKFVSRDTKISHAKSAEFQKWKNDRKMMEEIVTEASETELLAKYLNSRGINPKYATKDQKIAHSKSGQFQKWKRDHQHDELNEDTNVKDMVCFDIPLLIRVLEFTREEMKTDIELHNMVERLINMRDNVPLDMTHYDKITQKLVKENHIAIAMGKMLDDESGMVLSQIEELERGCAMIRSYIGKDYEKQLPAWVQAKVTLATDYMSTVGNYLVSKNEKVNEEVLDEAKKPRTTALQKWRKAAAEREKKHSQMPTGDMKSAIDRLEKHLTKENTLDSMAATEAPSDCSDNTNSTPSTGKSYAARMVKDLKKKTVKEETYDWEKDDKSSQEKSYGKTPKMNMTDKKGNLGDTKPEARAVMKGGTTLTGQPRDMVEIDPAMKQRPGQQDKGQNTFTSPIGKKSPSL